MLVLFRCQHVDMSLESTGDDLSVVANALAFVSCVSDGSTRSFRLMIVPSARPFEMTTAVAKEGVREPGLTNLGPQGRLRVVQDSFAAYFQPVPAGLSRPQIQPRTQSHKRQLDSGVFRQTPTKSSS
jgi:hypothetical protein